jgi:galactosamine-6-phosphate isomerase
MSRRGARIILEELTRKPNLLLCASAGGTPSGTYALLAAQHSTQPGLFRKLRVLQIDEWGGLPPGHPASCETDLRTKLVDPLGLGPSQYVGFNTASKRPKDECDRIRAWLDRHGPIDLCILGLGLNGHVAMNEPGDFLEPHVHVARLAPSSQQHPMLAGLRRKPRYGLSLGMADILSSRKILLLVSGAHKRAALKLLLKPQVSPRFPASFLWLHPNTTVLCDREAYGKTGQAKTRGR